MSNVRDLIEAYGSWVEEKVEEGWDVYIPTFVFHPLPGSPATMKAIMQREVERVYATLLTRVVRYPNSPGSAGKLPIWIVLPDYPVPKHDKKSLREVTLNDGLHLHALGLIPPNSRLRQR